MSLPVFEAGSTPLEQQDPVLALVLSGQKPGAFTDPIYLGDELHPGYDQLGLVTYDSSWQLAVSQLKLAGTVIEQSGVIEELAPLVPEITKVAEAVSPLVVARALASLSDAPRLTGNNGFELPEVAALEGALLGYDNCDIDYYLRTRYLDEPEDPITTSLFIAISNKVNPWPDSHILCPDCSVPQIEYLLNLPSQENWEIGWAKMAREDYQQYGDSSGLRKLYGEDWREHI